MKKLKKLKKLLAALLVLILLAACLPSAALAAEEPVKEGTCGENLTWTLTADGTLTISGTGPMYNNFFAEESPWSRLTVKKVIIEEGVTSVGPYAFSWGDAKSLESVSLPSSITLIGDSAFAGCTNLTSIDLPDGLKSISHEAFAGTGLTSIEIPASVTVIQDAFRWCLSLTRIKFLGNAPDKTWLSEYAFSNVKATVYYPAGNETWTEEIMQSYGGELTWVAYEPEPEATEPETTAPAPTPTTPADNADPTNPKTADAALFLPMAILLTAAAVTALTLAAKRRLIG